MSFPGVPEELNIEATEESGVAFKGAGDVTPAVGAEFGTNPVNAQESLLGVRSEVTPMVQVGGDKGKYTQIDIKKAGGATVQDDNDDNVHSAKTWAQVLAEDLVD